MKNKIIPYKSHLKDFARELRKNNKEFLKDKLWGEHFWSPSYFLATTGNVTIDILKNYVENQRTLQE